MRTPRIHALGGSILGLTVAASVVIFAPAAQAAAPALELRSAAAPPGTVTPAPATPTATTRSTST